MNRTSNLELCLYETTDKFNITASDNSLNANMIKIDDAITKKANISDVEAYIEEKFENVDNIPSYWQTALEAGAEAINTALCTAGSNKSAFLFYSDTHYDGGSRMSPKLLKYLYQNTGLTKTFFGGDIVNTESTNNDTMKYLWEWRKQIKNLPNHHSVVGNHDDGNATNNLFSPEYVYGYLMAAEETPDIVRGSDMYYYIDSPNEQTRYLFLDTAYKADTKAQKDFVKETLISTPNNWHIIAIAHAWYQPDYEQDEIRPIPIQELSSYAAAYNLCQIFDKYNGRVVDTNTDYSKGTAKVEFCIGGHVHRDFVGATGGIVNTDGTIVSSPIPIILVETDGSRTRGKFAYELGTTNESSVNGIIADYDNNTLNIVRVGRGNSFTINLDKASTITYYSITNKLTNVSNSSVITNIEENSPYVATLSTTGTMISVVITMGGADITSTVYDASTGAINIEAVTGDVVITAVAEIDEPIINQIPISTDTDGSIFNGVGYLEKARISGSSNGDIKTEADGVTDYFITGFIPFVIKETHADKLYGSSGILRQETKYGNCNICLYNSDKVFKAAYYANNSDYITLTEDSGFVFKPTHSGSNANTAYIRVTGVLPVTNDTIITVNQPIN